MLTSWYICLCSSIAAHVHRQMQLLKIWWHWCYWVWWKRIDQQRWLWRTKVSFINFTLTNKSIIIVSFMFTRESSLEIVVTVQSWWIWISVIITSVHICARNTNKNTDTSVSYVTSVTMWSKHWHLLYYCVCVCDGQLNAKSTAIIFWTYW